MQEAGGNMINLFIPSKKTLFLIGFLVFFIIVLTIITALSSPPAQTPQPSPSPTSLAPTTNLPDISPIPDIVYNPTILEKDYERLNADVPLSNSDSQIRSRLIASLNNQSGILEQTPDFTIKYIKSRDIFMVEISSQRINPAKTESLEWFSDQGLSTEGICNLPVSLYISLEVRDYLAGQGLTFDPIPEGCQ